MPYPPFLLRRTSFRQKETAGQDFSTADLDAEQNDETEIINELNRRLRLITDVRGQLINIASQIAQALVGAQRLVSTLGQTVFTTSLTWDSNFSNQNVIVNNNGDQVDPSDVSVADNAGVLEVTISGGVILAGWVMVAAYSHGAGIAARLADTGDPDNGAVMIGVYDVDGNFISTNVEGVLAELKAMIDAITTALGTIASIWTRGGTSIGGDAADGDFDLGTQKIINLGDGVDPQDAVTMAQLAAFTQNLAAVVALFIRADGAVEFTANQSMGGFKLTDVGAPSDAGDAAPKSYVDAQVALATADSVAPDGLKDSPGRGTMTGGLTFGQTAGSTADLDQTTTPADVLVPTLAGLAKPSAPNQAANKQYVDEQIASGGTAAFGRSIYAAWLAPLPAFGAGGVDLDGAITNIGGGGLLMGTSLNVSVPTTLTADTHIFVDGNVTISATITGAGFVLEISASGSITVSAAISAQDIRLRGDSITTSGTGTLTADSAAGVVALDSIGAMTIGANVTALMVFGYVGGIATVSSTIRASGIPTGISHDAPDLPTRWNSPIRSAVDGSYDLGAQFYGWGRGARDLRYAAPDYMTPYAGYMVGSPAASGGGGAVAGGRGIVGTVHTVVGSVQPLRGAARPWMFPAAPGGIGGRTGKGGGVIVFVVTGNAVFTGGVFNASGDVSGAGMGGGGGTVKIAVRGTVADGTYKAAGATTTGSAAGSGGGGTAQVVRAGAASGVQTYDVTGGQAGASGSFAENGVSGTVALADAAQWDTLHAQGFFER